MLAFLLMLLSADLLLPLVPPQSRLQGSQPLHLQLLGVNAALRRFQLSAQTLHLRVASPVLPLLLVQRLPLCLKSKWTTTKKIK